MAEWSIAPGCKPGALCGCAGSNPAPWTMFRKENPRKESGPYLFIKRVDDRLVVKLSDGKNIGTLFIPISEEEKHMSNQDIFESYLIKKFGEDINNKKITEVIKKLLTEVLWSR